MIDPKLNEIPVKGPLGGTQAESDAETVTERSPAARKGLSINDTIAGDVSLSVGSRGVDTSGTRAGAGAGAGSTSLTAGESASPAPSVVPGARQTGTTPASAASSGQTPFGRRDTGLPGTGRTDLSESGDASLDEDRGNSDAIFSSRPYTSDAYSSDEHLDYSAISSRAYECWCERGQPTGSPDVDWERAVSEYRQRRSGTKSSAATA